MVILPASQVAIFGAACPAGSSRINTFKRQQPYSGCHSRLESMKDEEGRMNMRAKRQKL